MPRGLLAKLREVFEGNLSIRKVANDPALMAELLLLLRMALADGAISERELTTLRRIAEEAFGIAEADLVPVMQHLELAREAVAHVHLDAAFGRRVAALVLRLQIEDRVLHAREPGRRGIPDETRCVA